MMVNKFKSGVAKIKYFSIIFIDGLILHGGKMVGRFIFPIFLVMNTKKYVTNESYFPECKRKNKIRIFFEQLFYIFRTGEINNNYFLFGFDRESNKDAKRYIPWLTSTFRRNRLNQQPSKAIYDPYNYVCLLRDKFVFEAFCKRIGINTPSNIAIINFQKIFLLQTKDIFEIDQISNYEMDAICKKNVPYGGGMPDNILTLKVQNGIILINNNRVTLDELKKIIGNEVWIIQERIKNQRNELAAFHPQSINTIRIVTIKKGSNVHVIFAVLRIGVNDSFTDNWSSGGICCGIDLKNGTLEEYGLFKPGLGTKSDRHPNTGVVFEGYQLPQWEEIIEYVKKAHWLFYGLHSIGWDVAVTTNGIVLIEGNDNWDTIDLHLYKVSKADYEKYFN